jgi:hypothetical protein|tara:strand:+ start:2512 stop:2853 length:342 start_codon:yes stop_codon:yes gene_type:complete
MTEQPFYESNVIREELKEMESLYLGLAKLSYNLPNLNSEEKLDHVTKTLELIAKQKVFYARLALMSYDDEEAREVKHRIDTMTEMYSAGKHINQVLDEMEDKLRALKSSLDNA